ncbi:CheY-like response regulator [Neokomagataea thailandica NBRC 106555]|uniref:CheY-like response regulator n=1 Tax=Neokomagataea thailandica NBRC 106555 TaxID=1223520 RepID=A0ABQ0QNV6_9PROT|nr:CheY-like response regulator [Neokomagataea thailandica NBRC 106555]
MEDDPSIAFVVNTILQREGWTVLQAGSAEEARLRFTEVLEQGEVISLIVADRNLGGGETGEELARNLRGQNPALATVVMSGDYEELAEEAEGVICLPKPFRKAALLDAIGRAQGMISP